MRHANGLTPESRLTFDRRRPIIDALAKCSGSCTTAKAADLNFFKIAQQGLTASSQTWATNKLMSNNLKWDITIPSTLAAGSYVLRHEIIALHGAGSQNGAQNYPQVRAIPGLSTECLRLTYTASASTCASRAEALPHQLAVKCRRGTSQLTRASSSIFTRLSAATPFPARRFPVSGSVWQRRCSNEGWMLLNDGRHSTISVAMRGQRPRIGASCACDRLAAWISKEPDTLFTSCNASLCYFFPKCSLGWLHSSPLLKLPDRKGISSCERVARTSLCYANDPVTTGQETN